TASRCSSRTSLCTGSSSREVVTTWATSSTSCEPTSSLLWTAPTSEAIWARTSPSSSGGAGGAESAMALVALETVLAEVLAGVTPLPGVDVALADASGLALEVEVTSPEQVPPFDNSAMDGYAVRSADTVGATPDRPVALRVLGELPAGRAPTIAVDA